MITRNESLSQRIITKLKAFNERWEAQLARNRELLAKMRAEKDFDKSMEYFKAFFSAK